MIRLPAEWEPQQAVLFSFPRREGDWGPVLQSASHAMLAAARQIAQVCPVVMIVGDQEHYYQFTKDFPGQVLYQATDDSWIRDSGPITVLSPTPTLLDFTFNGWGGKFSAEHDNQLPWAIHRALFPQAQYTKVNVVLEGGAIETDGRGTFMTTSRCLLSKGRNDFQSKEEAEAVLRNEL
ncbi:MAG: agmatine deiminase family protein, partial [Lewinella sp.]